MDQNILNDKRKIGLELEFAGLDLEQTAEIICSLFGGNIEKKHRYHITIKGSALGDFRVELDARLLQKMASNKMFDKLDTSLNTDTLGKSIEDIVDKLARSVVPLEIVMPPVAIHKLPDLEELRVVLQQNRAEGTGVSFVNAFGMHINIEAPDLEVGTLIRYLRAFMLVYPWLLHKSEIDISRRITPFIDPFPKPYVQKVLNPAYNPSKTVFIEDYLHFNPTRNRPLDLLPVFGMLQPDLLQPVLKGQKNDPRPAFHYRLPNSRIDDPAWNFGEEWQGWLAVEQLAADSDLLHKLSRLYLLRKEQTVISFQKEWVQTIIIFLGLDE